MCCLYISVLRPPKSTHALALRAHANSLLSRRPSASNTQKIAQFSWLLYPSGGHNCQPTPQPPAAIGVSKRRSNSAAIQLSPAAYSPPATRSNGIQYSANKLWKFLSASDQVVIWTHSGSLLQPTTASKPQDTLHQNLARLCPHDLRCTLTL